MVATATDIYSIDSSAEKAIRYHNAIYQESQTDLIYLIIYSDGNNIGNRVGALAYFNILSLKSKCGQT